MDKKDTPASPRKVPSSAPPPPPPPHAASKPMSHGSSMDSRSRSTSKSSSSSSSSSSKLPAASSHHAQTSSERKAATMMKKVLIDAIVAVVFVQTLFFYIRNRAQIANATEPDAFGYKFIAAMVTLATVHAAGTGSAVYTVCQFVLNNAVKLLNTNQETATPAKSK